MVAHSFISFGLSRCAVTAFPCFSCCLFEYCLFKLVAKVSQSQAEFFSRLPWKCLVSLVASTSPLIFHGVWPCITRGALTCDRELLGSYSVWAVWPLSSAAWAWWSMVCLCGYTAYREHWVASFLSTSWAWSCVPSKKQTRFEIFKAVRKPLSLPQH